MTLAHVSLEMNLHRCQWDLFIAFVSTSVSSLVTIDAPVSGHNSQVSLTSVLVLESFQTATSDIEGMRRTQSIRFPSLDVVSYTEIDLEIVQRQTVSLLLLNWESGDR